MKHQVAIVEHQRKVTAATRRALRAALAEHRVAADVLDQGAQGPQDQGRGRGGGESRCGNGPRVRGDGTVRAAAEALVDTGVALAVLPTGTANFFASGLTLPTDPAAVIEAIAGGSLLHLDTGRCNDLTFTVMAGTGLDAAMIDEADSADGFWAKERLGVVAYFRAGLIHARSRQPFPVEIVVDGAPFFQGPATCVLVGNLGTGGIRRSSQHLTVVER